VTKVIGFYLIAIGLLAGVTELAIATGNVPAWNPGVQNVIYIFLIPINVMVAIFANILSYTPLSSSFDSPLYRFLVIYIPIMIFLFLGMYLFRRK
jgi:hypothetical protein